MADVLCILRITHDDIALYYCIIYYIEYSSTVTWNLSMHIHFKIPHVAKRILLFSSLLILIWLSHCSSCLSDFSNIYKNVVIIYNIVVYRITNQSAWVHPHSYLDLWCSIFFVYCFVGHCCVFGHFIVCIVCYSSYYSFTWTIFYLQNFITFWGRFPTLSMQNI